MSAAINPATGQPLPADALQRVLFVTPLVHVYTVPPLSSMKGYTAADWTVPDSQTNRTRQIFSARLRILETAIHDKVTADILLEDPNNGSLFAAAPYTDSSAVEHVLDSSRFFVLRVVGEGRKALLVIGFEDRSDAFDFGVALQETRKVLRIPDGAASENKRPSAGQDAGSSLSASASFLPSSSSSSLPPPSQSDNTNTNTNNTPKDYSLKPGQTITIGGGRRRPAAPVSTSSEAKDEEQALFSIPPPPSPGAPVSSFSTTPADQPGRRKRPTSAIISTPDNKPILGFEDSATFD